VSAQDAPPPTSATPANYLRIPFLGLEIEKRTDFLALAAFSLALLSAAYQLFGFLRGFDVALFRPEQVLVVFDDYGNSRQVTRIHARMAYINLGQAGYNAALAKERVLFTLGDRTYEQVWQIFQSFDADGTELVPHFESDARPTAIGAGSAISHETYFAPHPTQCLADADDCDRWINLLSPNEFIALLKDQTSIKFTFVAELFGGDSVTAECTIEVDAELFSLLAVNGWAAPLCRTTQ
jgi:hypothetical protein